MVFGLLFMLTATVAMAQGVKPLPSIHVDGRWLVDTHGNHVVLHGVMDTPSAWFNNGRWGWSYDDAGRPAPGARVDQRRQHNSSRIHQKR